MSACAACKLMKRRCAEDCMFSPYFPSEDPQRFASVHKVFGTSNVNKMLQEIPADKRADAVNSIVYEANLRIADPIYGCVGVISSLREQVANLNYQLTLARAEILYPTTNNNNMRMMMPTVEDAVVANPTLELFPLEPDGLAGLGRSLNTGFCLPD